MRSAANSPRKPCVDCVRKHLGQAIVLFQEAMQGYPDHRWLAMGHMAEASAEIEGLYLDIADLIRVLRKKAEADSSYVPNLLDVIHKITMLVESEKPTCNCQKTSRVSIWARADAGMVSRVAGMRLAIIADRLARKSVRGLEEPKLNFYHVTSQKNLESIKKHGLKKDSSVSFYTGAPDYKLPESDFFKQKQKEEGPLSIIHFSMTPTEASDHFAAWAPLELHGVLPEKEWESIAKDIREGRESSLSPEFLKKLQSAGVEYMEFRARKIVPHSFVKKVVTPKGQDEKIKKPLVKKDWWEEKTDKEKKQYCNDHPASHYCPKAAGVILELVASENIARRFMDKINREAFLGHDALDDGGIDKALKVAGWEMKRAGYNFRVFFHEDLGQLEIRITADGQSDQLRWFVKLEDEALGSGWVARSGDAVPEIAEIAKGLR